MIAVQILSDLINLLLVRKRARQRIRKICFALSLAVLGGPCYKESALRMHVTRCHKQKCDDPHFDSTSETKVESDNESVCGFDYSSVDESCDSDCSALSMCSSRSNSNMQVNSAVIIKGTVLRKIKERCKDCGNSYVDLSKHLKCSNKLRTNSIQQANSHSVDELYDVSDKVNTQVGFTSELLLESDNKSVCSIEMCAVAGSSDSDSSIRSTKNKNKVHVDSPVIFKAPLPQPRKEICKDCGNSYVSLSKHVKCSKKLLKLIKATSCHSDDAINSVICNMTVDSDMSVTDELPIDNVKCDKCFVNLSDQCLCLRRNESGDRLLEDSAVQLDSHSSITSSCTTDQESSNESGSGILEVLSDAEGLVSSLTKKKRSCRRSGTRQCFICSCNKKFRNEGLLMMHKVNEQTGTSNTGSSVSKECDANKTAECKQVNNSTVATPVPNDQGGTTQKPRLKRDLQLERDYLKHKYLATEVVDQVDPLFDALKQYQEELLNRISNVTTERL